MEELELSPEALDMVASVIEYYCRNQIQAMSTYVSRVRSHSSEWDDDRTMGQLLQRVEELRSKTEAVLDQLRSTYPAYFRRKAEIIRNRPAS